MKSHSDMLYKQLFGHPEMVRDLRARDSRDALPADMDEKISAADVEQLRSWVKLLVGGATPQQVFAGR